MENKELSNVSNDNEVLDLSSETKEINKKKSNKKKWLILSAIILGLILVGGAVYYFVLGKSNTSNKLKIEYLPFKSEKDENWGMIGADGKVLFKDEFDKNYSVSSVINGVFNVTNKKGLVSVYTATEKPQIINGCEDLKDAGVMSEGIIPIVRKGERIKYVNGNGKEYFTLTPYKGHEIEEVSPVFHDKLAYIKTDEGKYGFINTSGKVVIGPKYDEVSVFNDGYAWAVKKVKNKDNKEEDIYYIINKSGKEIKKLKKDINIESRYYNNYFLASMGEKDKQLVLLDKNGNIFKKFPSKITNINDYDNKTYIYKNKEDKWGINTMKDDKTIIRAKYDVIYKTDNGYLAKKNDKFLLIDEKDNKIKELDESYEYVFYLDDWKNLIAIDKDEKCELLNLKGEEISKDSYILGLDGLSVGAVTSDYFDATSVAKLITDKITDTGIGNIHFNDNVFSLLPEYASPYSYSNKNTFQVYGSECGLPSGNKYSTALSIITNKAIAQEHYSYETYYYWTYKSYEGTYFNKDIKAEAFMSPVSVETSNAIKDLETLAKNIYSNMKAKGFKVIVSESGIASKLSKNGTFLYIVPLVDENSTILEIVLAKKDNLVDIKEKFKEYQKAKEKYIPEEERDYDINVTDSATEVAVESATTWY